MKIKNMGNEQLLKTKETVELDILSLEKALRYVPPDSVLARLSINTNLSMLKRKLDNLTSEIVQRARQEPELELSTGNNK